MNPRLIPALVVLSLLLAAVAAAEPCSPPLGGAPPGSKSCDERGLPGPEAVQLQVTPPTPPALGAPAVPIAPIAPLGEGGPSLLGALARLLGAVIVLALLMAAGVLGYRRLVERAGTRAGGVLAWAAGWSEESDADAVRVASRRYLGGRESIAVIHAAGERFLVGVTAGQISLLARLETPAAEPAPDFTEALAAMERSRERLGRLGHLTVVPRDGRG